MSIWPATLPPPALNTMQEVAPNNSIRSSMDKGPDIVRRRTTANVRLINFSMNLSPEQTDVLDDFYTNTTASGSLSFTYTHPRTGQVFEARFRGDPPQYNEREGMLWVAQVSLELLP